MMIDITKYSSRIDSTIKINQTTKSIFEELINLLNLDYISLYSLKSNPIYSTLSPSGSHFKTFTLGVHKNIFIIDEFMSQFSLEILKYFNSIKNDKISNVISFEELNLHLNITDYRYYNHIKNYNFVPFYFDDDLISVLVLSKHGSIFTDENFDELIEKLSIIINISYYKKRATEISKYWNESIYKNDLMDFYSELLRKISNNIPGVIIRFETTKDDKIIVSYANKNIEYIFGISFEEIKNDISNLFDFVIEGEKEKLLLDLNKSRNDLNIWKENYKIKVNNVNKLISIEARPEKDSKGNVIWYGYISDISDIEYANNKIIEHQAYKKSLLNALNDSVIVSITDIKGKIKEINEAFISISGYSRDELLGNDHNIVNSSFHPKEFWFEMWKAIRKGNSWRARVKNKKKNGNYYWVDTIINPIFDSKGEIQEFLSIRYDITNEVILENINESKNSELKSMLKNQSIELEKANQLINNLKDEIEFLKSK